MAQVKQEAIGFKNWIFKSEEYFELAKKSAHIEVSEFNNIIYQLYKNREI
jgi:hypothetical protein